MDTTRAVRTIALMSVVAAGYWLAARLALLMAIPPGYASGVWPAAGLALGAVLVGGYRMCLPVAVGSLLANLPATRAAASGVDVIVIPALLACGAGLQAGFGAWLVRRVVGDPPALVGLRDIGRFLAFAGPIGCLVAATWGVTTLALIGPLSWDQYAVSWGTWWVGDSIGTILFTPLVLSFVGAPAAVWRRRRLSLAVPVIIGLALVTGLFVVASGWEHESLQRAGADEGSRGLQSWLMLTSGLLFVGMVGGGVLLVTGRATELESLIQVRTADLRRSLEEKEVLLREVHHRVKNNLQVISSLLALQQRRLEGTEAAQALGEAHARVRSISLVHDQLYRAADLGDVDFHAYLETLVARLAQTAGPGVEVSVDVAPVQLGVDRAIPCGLIVNELVTNALKHAFAGRAAGRVRVELRDSGPDELTLSVSDDGVGLPAGFDPAAQPTLGLVLVRTLAQQIGGQLVASTDRGARFAVRFARSG